ncbi:MAG: sigma 54-interacting transcriptional regulator [Deltaproteobacteria bacterium]|nr:sigma 54-interacting transcriptional regulator [Deltaproteobacteria bacterium]
MAELLFFRRGEEVLRYQLPRGRVVLGRGEQCDVALPDPAVSRQAAALTWDGQALAVEDLSGGGLLVGGQPLSTRTLADGQDLSLGQWRAVFRAAGTGDDEASTVGAGNATAVRPADPLLSRWQPAQVRMRRGGQETVQRLQGDAFTVGKDPGNDLVVDDPYVSSRHLRVAREEGLFRLQDLQSKNGTWLGNVRVHEVVVPLLTTVKLGGEVELSLEPLVAGKAAPAFHGIIGADASVKQLVELVQRVAPSSAAVAVLGESGTGKELVAAALHARSPRASAAFIPVNCAAISKELIESELFGHEKGAFTGAVGARKGAFEEADGGTLFLDEVGELPLDLQAKLLRALESGEIKRVGASRPMTVDVRVVAATNRDLLQLAREGRFREDLYYRLCVVPLHLPPLRSRKGDIPALAEEFVQRFAPRGHAVRFTAAALERMKAHPWPGNIRELRNVVHRALLLRRGPMIDAEDLHFDAQVHPEVGVIIPQAGNGLTLEQMLGRVEREIVEAALKKYRDNRERVAKELGMSRSTLFKKLKEWGLTAQSEPEA